MPVKMSNIISPKAILTSAADWAENRGGNLIVKCGCKR
jgi:hypothetical protein